MQSIWWRYEKEIPDKWHLMLLTSKIGPVPKKNARVETTNNKANETT